MTWIQKYNVGVSDIKGITWYAKVYKENASTGSITLTGAGNPISFEFTSQDDNVFSPIKDVEAKLTVISPSNFYLSDIYSESNMTYKTIIFQNGEASANIFWQGYIEPRQYREPYDNAPFPVEIKCGTGLSLLKDIPYKDSSGNYYNGRLFESQIISDVLAKIGYSEFTESINVYEASMGGSRIYSPMNQLKIDVDVFKDKYCDEVLEEILKKYNACITQKDGNFVIYRPIELIDTSVNSRTFIGSTLSSSTNYVPDQHLNREAYTSNLQTIPGGVMMLQPSYKKVTINEDYGNKDSWIDNWQFKLDTYDVSNFSYWTKSAIDVSAIPLSSLIADEEGLALNHPTNTNYLSQDFGFACASTLGTYFIEFEYGYWTYTGRTPESGAKVLIQQKGKYLNTAGDGVHLEWTTGTNGITMEINSTLGWGGWNSFKREFHSVGDGSLNIKIFPSTYDTTYLAIKDIKFYTTSQKVTIKKQKRKLKQRIVWGAGKKGWEAGDNRIRHKYYYEEYTEPIDNITSYTFVVDNSINSGEEVDYDYNLCDVINQSSPVNDRDVSLGNILEQFAGSLAVTPVTAPTITQSTKYWNTKLGENIPLLEIIGEEIANQYSIPYQLIQLPIMETSTGILSLNRLGNFQDEKNPDKFFVFNRGSLDIRNRLWNIDMAEIKTSRYTPIPSGAITINSVTVASGWASATDQMHVTVNYTSLIDGTADFNFYRSSDEAGELVLGSYETTLGVAITTGTHDVDISESTTGYEENSHYVQVKLSTGSWGVDSATSNLFNVMKFDHIDAVADPQYVGTDFDPDVTFQVTSNGTVNNVPTYWEVRSSSHTVLSSGNTTRSISNGTNTYSFSSITVPASVGINRDVRIGGSASNMILTSNHFEIIL